MMDNEKKFGQERRTGNVFPRINFEWSSESKIDKRTEQIAKELFEKGVEYLRMVVGKDYPLPPEYNFVMGGKREKHGNIGAEMHLSVPRLMKFSELGNVEQDREQSLIIHEIIHNLQDEEFLPMLGELSYMLERGHESRLQELKNFFKQGKLPQPYVDGLNAIAKSLGMSLEDLLDHTSQKDTKKMREVFRAAIGKIIEDSNRDLKEDKAALLSEMRI